MNKLQYIVRAEIRVVPKDPEQKINGRKEDTLTVKNVKNEKIAFRYAKGVVANQTGQDPEKFNYYITSVSTDYHWGKVAAAGALAFTAFATGLGFFIGAFTSVAQNTVTLYRNKLSGELVFKADAGTKLLDPFLSKVGAMATTQQEAQFGNDDPSKGIGGYLPFNDSKNNEFNASINVKWTVAHTGASAIEDARALYRATGAMDIHSGIIVSTIKQAAIKSMQEFVLKSENGGPVETLQILSSKSAMAAKMKTDIQSALDAKYNIDGTTATGYIRLDAATIGDIVAPTEIKESIAKAAAASIESANAKQVAINQQAAAQAELSTRQQQQKVKEQEALNELLGDPMIISALVAAGVDTSNVNSISQLATALQGKNVDLVSIIKTSKYFEKWNGQLPHTLAGQGTSLSLLMNGAI